MIKYKKRRKYKYNLHSDLDYNTGIEPDAPGQTGLVSISKGGLMAIKSGYSWDGPSGPSVDTKNFMRGSLVHDALYQLIREGVLKQSDRKAADVILRTICLEDGMSTIRAWYVYLAVRIGAAGAATPDMLSAP